jgi:hypothetical protein
MGIREIDARDAQLLVPHRDPLLQFFAVEKAWFASDDEQLLGTVIYCRATKSWSYVVLGNDERGFYRWIAGEIDLANQQEASDRLRAEMEQIAATGQDVFPRPLKRVFQRIRERSQIRRSRRAARRRDTMQEPRSTTEDVAAAASASYEI